MNLFRFLALYFLLSCSEVIPAEVFLSHSPMRPLPEATNRPLTDSVRTLHVDPGEGSDEGDGSKATPWKTITHAASQLQPGDTLVLQGGVYHEHPVVRVRASEDRPVIIRSAPGELAIIDGGLPEFLNDPASSWEPFAGGAEGEYRSTRQYPGRGEKDGVTNVHGLFADSLIPLHGYRLVTDLRSSNDYFAATSGAKSEADKHIYCGPGLWYHPETGHIHVRLAHTNQTCLESTGDNYAGETDPRKIPLIVARIGGSALVLEGAAHVILQDLVVRGARDPSIDVKNCSNITLDGVSAHGGSAAIRIAGTSGLRCVDSAFRGAAAPWTWRGSLKYRAIETRIVSASGGWNPPARPNRDFEFTRCEFTDSVDGVFIGGVDGASIHHCILDNVSDDGTFVTCNTAYDGTTTGGPFHFHDNLLSRCLTTFAFGVGKGRQRTIDAAGNKQLGKGLRIERNFFDFRRPVLYQQPPEGDPDIITFGRVLGDHGGPGWEPMVFSKNTFLSPKAPWRNYFGNGLAQGMGKGTRRSVMNNIFYQFTGLPGQVLPSEETDFTFEGNLHWSAEALSAGAESWKLSDRYGDPGLASVPADFTEVPDLRPAKAGPGMIQPGESIPRVGVRGRFTIFGEKVAPDESPAQIASFAHSVSEWPGKRAALVKGYPAFDAPIVQFILEKAGYRVDVFDRIWLPVDQYLNYEIVVFNGDTVRAKMEPSGLAPDEFGKVRAFMEKGGTLVLMRGNARQFYPGDKGRAELESITGSLPRGAAYQPELTKDHPWLTPLDGNEESPTWMTAKTVTPLPMPEADNAIADPTGMSILGRVSVGKGGLTHIGWIPSAALPSGRKKSTLEDERAFDVHYGILENVLVGK